MNKLIAHFFVGTLIVFTFLAPRSKSYAQGLSLPAEMNQGFSPLSIPLGGTARLRVAIFNPNAFALTNASWTNNLIREQPGLVIADPVDVENTCSGSVTAVGGSTSLSLSGGTVPAQAGSTPGRCTVTINVTSTTTGNLITTIPAGALSASGGGTTITNTSPASATLHVGGVLSRSIRKSFSSATIWVGEISRLSILITNNDPDTTLTQVSLRDELPADVFLANPPSPNLEGCGASASLTAASGGASVTLNNGAIAPGSICTIAVNVTSDVQGRHTNRIADHALQTQQGLTNLSEAVTRLNVQAIGLDKHFSPSTFPAGGTTSLLIILRNPMDSPYKGVSVSDTLPAPLTIVGLTENTCGGSVSTTADTISLSGGTVPAGSPSSPGTCRLSFDVTAPSGASAGTFRNSIPAGGLTTDQGIGNLSREDAAVTVSSTEVTGIKSFSPSTIQAGGSSRLRIDIFGPSDTDLTNFSLVDDLPAGLTVSSSTPPSIHGCGSTSM